MTNRISALSTILRSPMRILSLVLVLVFTAEVAVMLALPHVTPTMLSEPVEAVVDAILLTLVCAPVLWLVIIGPLRRIAIQEHQRSETIVANAGESILTFGRDGTVLSCNRAATEIFSIDAETLIGRSIRSLVPAFPDNPDQLPSEFRLDGVRGDGEQFPLQISVSDYPSEARQTRIAIVRDLTDAQKSENERITMARKTEALRAQQMTTLAQLATGVAHEIRNPLTSIKMLIQVNRAKFADEGLPTDDLELVEQEIRRMERSVNSLLDFARPETSEFKRFAIQEAVRRTVQLIEGRCRNQNVELNVTAPDGSVFVEGDAAQIQQLLLNLGLNALDAMPTGGTLNLTITQADDQVAVAVCDSGAGISAHVLDKLFTPFVTTKTNGIGLGLGICHRIADAHHGKLTGTNQTAGGAKFQLNLPIAPDSQAAHQSESSDHSLGQSQEPPCKAC
ncbi:MAG: ATP-binding protein [Rubripirellula sp.]